MIGSKSCDQFYLVLYLVLPLKTGKLKPFMDNLLGMRQQYTNYVRTSLSLVFLLTYKGFSFWCVCVGREWGGRGSECTVQCMNTHETITLPNRFLFNC